MTKQDEIREGIAKIVDKTLVLNTVIALDSDKDEIAEIKYWAPERQEALYELRESTIQRILSYLHSQGVVLKVERKLPFPMFTVRMNDPRYQDGAMIHAQKLMLEAGFVAAEPLLVPRTGDKRKEENNDI